MPIEPGSSLSFQAFSWLALQLAGKLSRLNR